MFNVISRVIVLLFLLSSCNKKSVELNKSRYNYPNVLDMNVGILNPYQDALGAMSDLGTWHAFSLVQQKESDMTTGFAGPYLMRQQKSLWLSPSILRMKLKDVKSGKTIDMSNAKAVENISYPGLLVQSFMVDDIKVTMRLFHANERSTLITTELDNKGADRELQLIWKGAVFDNAVENITLKNNRLQMNIGDNETAALTFSTKDVSLSDSCYLCMEEPFILSSNSKKQSAVAFVYALNAKESHKYNSLAVALIEKSAELFADNEKRWNTYINTLLKEKSDAILNVSNYENLAVKSLITLIYNWRTAAGSIHHQGIVPSYSANYFQGLWAWDSWKHAVAIAPFEPELAKDQIRAMYDYQNQEGMIADCFFRNLDTEGVNWRNTKAPLSGWSIYEVYAITKDVEFLKEMYPKLAKYHQWWYENRDHDANGLCEYGSTDGTRIAAAWESGMDNAVRFDSVEVIKNSDNAYSVNQESVDLNAYLYREKIYLKKIAQKLNDIEMANFYAKQAEELRSLVLEKMYCSEDGFFYDIKMTTHNKLRIQGPEGWSPLYNELATSEQAAQLVGVIMDEDKFNTSTPFPTLSAAREEFNPQKGYWRGPVWLDQAYFAIKGMHNYGYRQEAFEMATKLVNNAEGLAHSQAAIRENYHPISNKGLNAHNFSWSAAHILMMF